MTGVRERPAALLVAVSRPWFWPVSWVPAYLGTVLAGRAWWPARDDLPRAVAALLVLGPLIWGAVLAQNDLHDLRSDRDNPRKATAPLVTGAVTERRLRVWYRAVAVALFVGPLFVLGVAAVLLLGWAYSVPPLRLKTRPGWDVTVNALVVGVVSPAAGWAITRQLSPAVPARACVATASGGAPGRPRPCGWERVVPYSAISFWPLGRIPFERAESGAPEERFGMSDIRDAVVAERTELARMLGDLRPEQWAAPSLCAGWRIREVVAHMTMPFRMTAPRFVARMVRARGNFNRMADRQARRDTSRLTDAQLLASLRDNVAHPWKPPGGGDVGALSHDVVHGLDISVALGLDRRPPAERVGLILADMRPRQLRYFGVDLAGVRLEATDLDFTLGAGAPLRGAAQDLLLVICGRRVPAAVLEGTPAARFSA